MQDNLLAALDCLDPAGLTYQEWCSVGMALKEEGYPCAVWDDWSRNDSRYHEGECQRKWEGFRGAPSPVTGGTIVQLAKERGYLPDGGHELDWDGEISYDAIPQVIDPNWFEGEEVGVPGQWNPAQELMTYLETLFDSTDNVGYVTESWEKEGKYLPAKGSYDRTAGQLIQALSQCGGDIGAVLGDYNPQAGAWIRFNPLDGKGVKNENVTEFRYALVESDTLSIEEQNAAIRKLELPVACLVHSGGKSLHAIVKVEAGNYDEYRKRVDYLYEVCRKNGLDIDRQNRNPSRLSRMPGVLRNGQRQWLIATNLGQPSWEEWKDWIEGQTDDLPDMEDLGALLSNPPPLAPPLIDGILRQGHKMLLAGPSKAGKSFALIQLCIALAEGTSWMGFPCAQGKVLYVNLELDRASCIHRFGDVYKAMGIPCKHPENVQIWNLRGRSAPMDQLTPKLIRRAKSGGFLAVVIDPIYKIITGDENSADQMAHFCNQFDKVATDLGCAVIYCHHHSKGAQGGKRSMDRASGSGVFARDPDAILDMIQLEVPEALLKQRQNDAVARTCARYLEGAGMLEEVSQDDLCSRAQMLEAVKRYLRNRDYVACCEAAHEAEEDCKRVTAWRISTNLREFPQAPDVNLWFDYPIHRQDESGVLADIQPEGDEPLWKRNLSKSGKRSKTPEERKKERMEALDAAFDACKLDDKPVMISDLAEYLGKSEDTVRRYLNESKLYWTDGGEVGRK